MRTFIFTRSFGLSLMNYMASSKFCIYINSAFILNIIASKKEKMTLCPRRKKRSHIRSETSCGKPMQSKQVIQLIARKLRSSPMLSKC